MWCKVVLLSAHPYEFFMQFEVQLHAKVTLCCSQIMLHDLRLEYHPFTLFRTFLFGVCLFNTDICNGLVIQNSSAMYDFIMCQYPSDLLALNFC